MKWNSLKFSSLVEAEKKRRRITNNSDMAILMEVSVNTLQNIMKGATIPSVEYLCKMAMFLGVDLPAFFDYDKTNSIVSTPVEFYEPETDISKCYKTMFEQQKEIADKQKEITDHIKEISDLKIEIERIKNENAVGGTAKAG